MRKTIKRRRLEAKTDYGARLSLLKANKPRFVVRKTNRYIIAQIVTSVGAQDKVIAGTSSKILLTKGWPLSNQGSLKSRAAAYLTGFALANIVKGKIKEAVLDMGMHAAITKGRIYAAVKGATDAGLIIPHNPKVVPELAALSTNDTIKKLIKPVQEKL